LYKKNRTGNHIQHKNSIINGDHGGHSIALAVVLEDQILFRTQLPIELVQFLTVLRCHQSYRLLVPVGLSHELH